VARALFNKLFEPSCLDRIFLIPANSKTVLIELPAITPEPGAEGRNTSLAAPNLPFVGCGIELELVNGIEIIFYLSNLAQIIY
jgi:hypothetical protein